MCWIVLCKYDSSIKKYNQEIDMKKIVYIIAAVLLCMLIRYHYATTEESTHDFKIHSSSFKSGGAIPARFTCTKENISPNLQWNNAPAHTESYLLLVDDPDAHKVIGKTFVHWIALLPASTHELPEGASNNESHLFAKELLNDAGKTHYYGPCPPPGSGIHTYRFTLFALNKSVEKILTDPHLPSAPFTMEQFEKHVTHTIVAIAKMTGTYQATS